MRAINARRVTGMLETDKVFAGSIPENYDRYMVPLIFEPYAADVARRAAALPTAAAPEIARGRAGRPPRTRPITGSGGGLSRHRSHPVDPRLRGVAATCRRADPMASGRRAGA